MRTSLFFTAFLAGFIGLKVNAQVGINTPNPTSSLTVNGSFAATYKTVSASGVVGADDYYIAYNGAVDGTLTLPSAINGAGNFGGRTYHFKNTGGKNLTIKAAGSELIDNQNGSGVSQVNIPPGYYAYLVSKGTTISTTWELVLLSSSTGQPSVMETYLFATDMQDSFRQSCPANSWTSLTPVSYHQGTVINTMGGLSSNGIFTAQSDGYYTFYGATQFDNSEVLPQPQVAPNFYWHVLYLTKNYGSTNPANPQKQLVQSFRTVNPPVSISNGSVSTVTYLKAGDTVSMTVAGAVDNGSIFQVTASTFYGYKIAN